MHYTEEFKSYYEAQILPDVKALEKKRMKRIYISGGVCILFFFILSLYFCLTWGFSAILVVYVLKKYFIPVIGFSAGLYFLIRKLDKSKSDLKHKVVKNIINYMGDFEYKPDEAIGENDLLRSRIYDMIAAGNTSFYKSSGNDYVSGKIDDIKLSFSEINSLYQKISLETRYRRSNDGHGNYSNRPYQVEKKTTHKLFKGLFFIASFKERFIDDFCCHIAYPGEIFQLFRAFPDGRFEKVLSPEQDNDLNKYLTLNFFQSIKDNNLNENIFVSIRENKIYIGIELQKDLFELSTTGEILKYEDIIRYYQYVTFVVTAIKDISSIDNRISSYETPADTVGRGICPWCNSKNSITNNMCKNCGYKANSS